jgi:GNAT superfamily N-acetyltransferase
VKLAFRPAEVDERRCLCPGDPRDSDQCSLVVSSWSSSYKKSYSAGAIHTDDWAGIWHKQATRHLARPGATTILAYEATDPSFLYGWIAGDTTEPTPIVFYVYVKESFRREGIATRLVGALGVDPSKPFAYTCQTPVVFEREGINIRNKWPRARWNPNELRYPKEARRGKWQTRPQ